MHIRCITGQYLACFSLPLIARYTLLFSHIWILMAIAAPSVWGWIQQSAVFFLGSFAWCYDHAIKSQWMTVQWRRQSTWNGAWFISNNSFQALLHKVDILVSREVGWCQTPNYFWVFLLAEKSKTWPQASTCKLAFRVLLHSLRETKLQLRLGQVLNYLVSFLLPWLYWIKKRLSVATEGSLDLIATLRGAGCHWSLGKDCFVTKKNVLLFRKCL